MNLFSKPLVLLAATVAQLTNDLPVSAYPTMGTSLMNRENAVYIEPVWSYSEGNKRRIRRGIPKYAGNVKDINEKLDAKAKNHPLTQKAAYHAGFNEARAILVPEISELRKETSVLRKETSELRKNLKEWVEKSLRKEEIRYNQGRNVRWLSRTNEELAPTNPVSTMLISAQAWNQILLGSQEEIKYIERLLVPLLKQPNPRSRYTRWMAIFVILSKHPIVAALIECIEKAGLSLHEFATEAQRFYGDDSIAIHGVRLPGISVKQLKNILTAQERKSTPSELKLLTILVECGDIISNAWNSTLDKTGTTEFEEQVVDEPRCVKLGRVNLSPSEFETKIKAFFYTKNENIVSVVHMQQMWGQGFYQIEFDSVGKAVYGFSNHAAMLGETSPKLYLTACNASEPLPYDGQMARHLIDFDYGQTAHLIDFDYR